MTDTGWTFAGFRVIESEYAPDPNRIKHLGAVSSDYSPFLSRIVNTCDPHGAILDVTDPAQNVRAAYDYHTRRSVNTSKERTMTGPRMDVLGLMAAAEPLWQTACEEYSEGESVAIIRAQLALHRHAVDLILERLDSE